MHTTTSWHKHVPSSLRCHEAYEDIAWSPFYEKCQATRTKILLVKGCWGFFPVNYKTTMLSLASSGIWSPLFVVYWRGRPSQQTRRRTTHTQGVWRHFLFSMSWPYFSQYLFLPKSNKPNLHIYIKYISNRNCYNYVFQYIYFLFWFGLHWYLPDSKR